MIRDNQSGGELIGALFFVLLLVNSLTSLIDLVTVAAFLAAPVYGYLSYRLITSIHTPEALQPGRGMRMLSWVGAGGFYARGRFPFCGIAWRQRLVSQSLHNINRHTN